MIVVGKRFLNSLLESGGIDDLFIHLSGSNGRHAIGPKQASDLFKCIDLSILLSVDGLVQVFKGLIEIELPGAVDGILGDIEQIQSILLIDQSIGKHS